MAGKGSRPRPYSVSQDQFAANYDAIFGKKSKADPSVINAYDDERLVSKYDKENQLETTKTGTCGCGRSPTGNCCGWHGLSQADYEQALETYNLTNQPKDSTQGG
jgi:hypothetical protein